MGFTNLFIPKYSKELSRYMLSISRLRRIADTFGSEPDEGAINGTNFDDRREVDRDDRGARSRPPWVAGLEQLRNTSTAQLAVAGHISLLPAQVQDPQVVAVRDFFEPTYLVR